MLEKLQIDLKDKNVVITGGGGVLGGAMAEKLGECGANIAIIDLKKEYADKTAEKILESGGRAIGIASNVLIKEELENAVSELEREFGKCDILINGAGGNHPKGTTSKEFLNKDDINSTVEDLTTFYDLDPEGIKFVFNLNFLGTLLPTQAFTKGMVEAEHGTVINISSMNAFCPLTKIPAYSAAKAAVSNFTQWLAVHFSQVGVRVNAIAPGFFLTNQNRSLLMNDDGTYTERAEKILGQTPMGRFGNPKELLGTLLWLVNDEASGFVNGTVIPVDGGYSAYSGV